MNLNLLRLFHPSTWRSVLRAGPTIQGKLRLELREGGKLRTVREGKNICTLTGREHITELLSLAAWSPRTTWREDRIGYLGVGTGAQPEVAAIESLVSPTDYRAGIFLAPVNAPSTFPASGSGTPRTAVQFIREYGLGEISIGGNVIVTEAGLFTDGDPNNNWDLGTFDPSISDRAPMFYKTFEPVTKSMQFTLRAVWEVQVT